MVPLASTSSALVPAVLDGATLPDSELVVASVVTPVVAPVVAFVVALVAASLASSAPVLIAPTRTSAVMSTTVF